MIDGSVKPLLMWLLIAMSRATHYHTVTVCETALYPAARAHADLAQATNSNSQHMCFLTLTGLEANVVVLNIAESPCVASRLV